MPKFTLLILCAGFGKRMSNLSKNTPKPLLKFKNTTLLDNTISFFKEIGCEDIFINTHYLYEKIESHVNIKYGKDKINIIYEPSILGIAGGIKNIFNYTKNKKICVVNSDIFWQSINKNDILNFVEDIDNIKECKILLSENNNFFGLKNRKGDFIYKNGNISRWTSGNEIIFFAGLQIVSKNIFQSNTKIFSMNAIWDKLISTKKLKGSIIQSSILHIGDKNSILKL